MNAEQHQDLMMAGGILVMFLAPVLYLLFPKTYERIIEWGRKQQEKKREEVEDDSTPYQ